MEKMLKENRNIDDSYTHRVIRQLVDETEIDFNTGRVRLPGPPFAWPFHNFGPGGLENALRMTAGNSFGHHIINNYGVDEEEFKEILVMYIGVIAGRIQDGLERENPPWLQEQIGYDDDAPNEVERQSHYATQVVDWMVRETKIDDSHEDPSQWNIYAPHMGRWISPLGFISPNNRHWSAFENHVMDIYGLDWELVGTAWNNYLKEVTTTFRLLAGKAQGDDTPPWDMQYDYLAESTEDNFLDKIVEQLLAETKIFNARGQLRAHPPFFQSEWEDIEVEGSAAGVVGGIPLEELIRSNEYDLTYGEGMDTSLVFMDFKYYCKQMYGLTWEECHEVWDKYREALYNTDFSHLYTPNVNLNESTEDNFLGTIVNQLVDETEIEYEYGRPHISGFPDPAFTPDTFFSVNRDLSQNLFGDLFKSFWRHCRSVYGLTDPEIQKVWWPYKKEILNKINFTTLNESLSSRVKKEVDDLFDKDKKLKGEDKIKKYFEDKGLDKWEADQAMVQYLSKQQSLNESVIGKNDDEVIGKEFWFEYHCWESPESCDAEAWYRSHQKVRVIGRGEDDHDQYPGEVKVYKIRFEDGLEYDVFEDELMDSPQEFYRPAPPINESVDLSYSDDKDFPFLNKLANHTMSITEISRNAVMFPFIEGYISDGNFYKYFNGTPYDQIPFEATIKMDGYLKDFGLTENEKEIWWDIYVIKVLDAINERDLKIIDNYGELNESTEDMYKKIANSVANESDILEKDGKLYLRSPAFEGGVNVEVVLDIMSGRTKRAIPNSFTKHMKEIYDIEEKGYNTVLETVWALYRDKMIERIKIKQAQLRQISPKQRKFLDHILKTLVDGTEIYTMKDWNDDETYEQRVWVTPPFLNHRVDVPRYREDSVEWNEFSYFGYGYPRYMKDIYGLTDQEGLKLWAPYYKALQKKIEELIERDRIIYGDDTISESIDSVDKNKPYLNKIVDKLQHYTTFAASKSHVYRPFYTAKISFTAGQIWYIEWFSGSLETGYGFKDGFKKEMRDVYGLTPEEIEYVYMKFTSYLIKEFKGRQTKVHVVKDD